MANERAKQISAHLNYPKGMLVGQTAIITGSGQGIGAEAARLFANEGAKVIISDIDKGRKQIGSSYHLEYLLTRHCREGTIRRRQHQ